MSDTPAPAVNGVDVGKLLATVAAIKAQPGLADFKFRAETDWKDGGHSRIRIQRFYGAGSEDTSRSEPFVLEGDEPPVLLGGNAGPNAAEIVLAGLASCLAVGFAYNAAAQGIRIEELEPSPGGGHRPPGLSRSVGDGPARLPKYPGELPHQERRAAREAAGARRVCPEDIAGARYHPQSRRRLDRDRSLTRTR